MPNFDLIAFDADDTLWHTERMYVHAQACLERLLRLFGVAGDISEPLYQTESRNVLQFGYGIKSFTLSMIETAVELTQGRLSGQDVLAIIDLGREMLSAEVELLEHAASTLQQVSARYPLMLITKGDLGDQQAKVARSGLAGYFRFIEVVSEKDRDVYARVLEKRNIPAERFLMVGNSLRSDVLPVMALGGQALYIPYTLTWQHESAERPVPGTPGFHQLEHLGQLAALLERLEADN